MEALTARREIVSLIESVAKEHNINDYKILDVKTNQKGEGYLGQIFIVTVTDEQNRKQLHVVVKAAFLDEKVRDMVPIRMSFENEINFYTEIKPAYEKLEKEHGIHRSTEFVNCLKVSLKQPGEILILENLRESGFEIFDKKSILDDAHVELIFKNYGRVHGYSYVLRDQKPEEWERITKGLHNVYEQFMTANDFFGKYMVELAAKVQASLIPGEDDEVIKKFEKYLKNIDQIYLDMVTKEVDYPAILHGDCWSNNMMFKYENSADGRKPVDMRLIDWQLIKVGSPVCDLSYCLYSGASKTVFDNLNQYLQIYYDSFSSHVRQLGSDPEKLFPFSALKDHWRKYSRFGMIMTIEILKIKLTNQEDIVDLTDDFKLEDFAEIAGKQKFDHVGYYDRIRGLLSHMCEVDAL